MGCQVSQVTQDVQVLRGLLAFPVPWDHWERKGSGGRQGSQVWKESEDHQALVEKGDNQVPRGNQAPRGMWARTGPLGSLEKRATQACKAPLDSLGQKALPVPRGKTGDLGTLDREENWAFKVRQAPLDQLV